MHLESLCFIPLNPSKLPCAADDPGSPNLAVPTSNEGVSSGSGRRQSPVRTQQDVS
ncbi:hypothetical protein SSAG_02395 [Streptomyces sp. Mg1]|nr:hypothetical protein SSAG_02395 [Streptomyces sp. Mg1]